jgi:hypothetical protein
MRFAAQRIALSSQLPLDDWQILSLVARRPGEASRPHQFVVECHTAVGFSCGCLPERAAVEP